MNTITKPFHKLYGSAVIAANLKGQRHIPFLQRSKIDEIRDQRIRNIVRYAAKRVPYYRDLFHREGINPNEINRASDLERLPLLSKELVRSNPQLFVADTSKAHTAVSFLSSGSTGTPMEVFHDRPSLLANIAYGERERNPFMQVCGGTFRPKELYIGYENSTFRKVVNFYEENVIFPVKPRRKFISMLEPVENVANINNSEKPDILVGYGGWIDLFFKTIAASGVKIHLPKMVLYMGEALPAGSRTFIEETFGVPILSRYNSVEAFKIGFFCEQRTGFHLHEDLCHVRIVGQNGQTVPHGEQGSIVITNLINRASVLLNYLIGDMAAISKEACSCGRTFQLLSELEGRVEDVIHFDDGRFIHPRAIWQIFKGDRDVIQYQLIQHEYRNFELILLTKDEPSYQNAVKRALPLLENLLGKDISIQVSRRTEFARSSIRKFRAVASMCKTNLALQQDG